MAQANDLTITDESPGKSAERLARDARLASAFRDMEGDLHDLRHMASLSYKEAAEIVHDLCDRHEGDKIHLDRALFAIGHVEDMINGKWDAGFSGAPEGSATGVGLR